MSFSWGLKISINNAALIVVHTWSRSMRESMSEVARLRQHITEEIEAMQRGFSGFAAGVARHEFIRARMEQLGGHQDELAEYVGEDDAAHIMCNIYISQMGNKSTSV